MKFKQEQYKKDQIHTVHLSLLFKQGFPSVNILLCFLTPPTQVEMLYSFLVEQNKMAG